MLKLTASPEGELDDQERPLISTAVDVQLPHYILRHNHIRAQLLYSTHGTLQVSVQNRQWLITPHTGIWIRPGQDHEVIANDAAQYRSVYIVPDIANSLTISSRIVTLKPLLRELINESACFGSQYMKNTPEHRLIGVLHDNLKSLPDDTCQIQIPSDRRLRKICLRILQNPKNDISLSQWCANSGTCERTIARLFRKQTGCSFTVWRQRVYVSYAIEKIRSGQSITTVALDLGYNSPSAFTAMFKRVLGITPSQYFPQ